MKPIIFFVGSTATGKSDTALSMAQKYNADIINSDSLQCYKELSIGTAKPSTEVLSSHPHHLFDYVSAPEVLTAGKYRDSAIETIEALRNKKPLFFVGGSGFYIQAIDKGMYDVPRVPEDITKKLEEEFSIFPLEKFYEELKARDPEYAKTISYADEYRIFRALNLIRFLGKSMTQVKSEFTPDPIKGPKLKIGLKLEKAELRKKVRKRAILMLEEGFVEEVELLLDKDLRDWAPLKSVGYKEVALYLDKKIRKDQLIERIVTSTMQLAKKQMTWFKRCLLYTSPSPRDATLSRMPSSA